MGLLLRTCLRQKVHTSCAAVRLGPSGRARSGGGCIRQGLAWNDTAQHSTAQPHSTHTLSMSARAARARTCRCTTMKSSFMLPPRISPSRSISCSSVPSGPLPYRLPCAVARVEGRWFLAPALRGRWVQPLLVMAWPVLCLPLALHRTSTQHALGSGHVHPTHLARAAPPGLAAAHARSNHPAPCLPNLRQA